LRSRAILGEPQDKTLMERIVLDAPDVSALRSAETKHECYAAKRVLPSPLK
jgi:hypothetical protein